MPRPTPVPPLAPEDDRLFVRNGRRVYRRSFSVREVQVGGVIVLVLGAIAVWVAWRGARPEPGLYGEGPELARTGEARDGATPAGAAGGEAPAEVPVAQGGSGPLSASLAPPGFTAGPPASFDAADMYVKIDGRADYYLTYGATQLHVLTLADAANPERTIDLELFELGSPASAIGAYGGERAGGAESQAGAAGLSHVARNALFGTHGRYYLRAIGCCEDPAMQEALREVAARLFEALPAEELPWSYALFTGKLGIPAGRISYEAENAFSLAAARDVHVAALDDDGTELFAIARTSPGDAMEHARELAKGLLEYGEPGGDEDGVAWIVDRYLGTYAGVAPAGSFVAGVRGASGLEEARKAVRTLRQALEGIPSVPASGSGAGAAAPPAENPTESAYN